MTGRAAPPLTDAALQALERAVGAAHLRHGGEALAGHHDSYGFGSAGEHVPAAAVLPASVDEIQAVLAVAREHRLPLWTVSTGRNLGYGGAAPRVSGSVVLDLQRMNRVLEVDDELGYAVVEPGVRFLDLYAHLQAHGHRLMMSVPDIGWGSVIGNALERGFGYAPMWDHAAHACGLEVVLADGRLLRTGMGAKAGSPTWHLYRGGFGPSLDGLLQQGSMGIVTRMGLHLLPRPATVVACQVAVPRAADLGALVDTLRPLLLDGTIQSNAIIGNATVIASAISERARWSRAAGAMPEADVQAMADGLGLGRWNARFGLYGAEQMTAARLAQVRAAVQRLPGATLQSRSYAGDTPASDVHPADHAQFGIPGLAKLRMAQWRSSSAAGAAHTDFSLVCRASGAEVERRQALIQRLVEAQGFDYAGGFTLAGRHVVALALLSFDRGNAQQTGRIAPLLGQLIEAAGAAGDAPYRAHIAFMDRIAAQYDFNGHVHAQVVQQLKHALDPLGLLSPGKQGIWPPGPHRQGTA